MEYYISNMQPNFKEYDFYCIPKAFYHALSNNDETNIKARLLNKSESKCGNANNVSAIFETETLNLTFLLCLCWLSYLNLVFGCRLNVMIINT